MEILAKNFSNRDELEEYITSRIGRAPDRKTAHTITGTTEELKKLHLSHGKECWGIAALSSDYVEPAKKTKLKHVDRGKIFKPAPEISVDIKNSKER